MLSCIQFLSSVCTAFNVHEVCQFVVGMWFMHLASTGSAASVNGIFLCADMVLNLTRGGGYHSNVFRLVSC